MPNDLPPRSTKSEHAGLRFPVTRVKSMLKSREIHQRVSDKAAVYMAGVMEYITAEIVELSLDAANREGKSRIRPNHMNVALKRDRDFVSQFGTAVVPNSKFVTEEKLANMNENDDRSHDSSQRGKFRASSGRDILGRFPVRKSKKVKAKKTSKAKRSASKKTSKAKRSASEKTSTAKRSVSPKTSKTKRSASQKTSKAKRSASQMSGNSKSSTSPKAGNSKSSASQKTSTAKRSESPKTSKAKRSASQMSENSKSSTSPKAGNSKSSASKKTEKTKQNSSEQETGNTEDSASQNNQNGPVQETVDKRSSFSNLYRASQEKK